MYREWHPNGKKSLRIKYIDGKENGTWTQWYENGRKQMKIGYVNGVPRGRAKFWFPDGSLKGEGILVSFGDLFLTIHQGPAFRNPL